MGWSQGWHIWQFFPLSCRLPSTRVVGCCINIRHGKWTHSHDVSYNMSAVYLQHKECVIPSGRLPSVGDIPLGSLMIRIPAETNERDRPGRGIWPCAQAPSCRWNCAARERQPVTRIVNIDVWSTDRKTKPQCDGNSDRFVVKAQARRSDWMNEWMNERKQPVPMHCEGTVQPGLNGADLPQPKTYRVWFLDDPKTAV